MHLFSCLSLCPNQISCVCLRAFISGTYRTVCWSGSIRVWHKVSTPFTPASVDTTRISSLAVVKVISFIPPLLSSGVFPMSLAQSRSFSQIIRYIFGTSAASCRSWSWRDTRAQWTVSAGTRVFPVLWPALLTTAQSVSGDPHPSWTHKSWTASMVQTYYPIAEHTGSVITLLVSASLIHWVTFRFQLSWCTSKNHSR